MQYKILIPVRLPIQDESVKLFKHIALKLKAQLVFLSVVNRHATHIKKGVGFVPKGKHTASPLVSELENMVSYFKKEGIKSGYLIKRGEEEEQILLASSQTEADLIFISESSEHKEKNELNLALSKSLCLTSFTPVLFVPKGINQVNFKRILFPVRFVSGIFDKLEFVIPLAKKFESKLDFIGLTEGLDYTEYYGIAGYVSHLHKISQEHKFKSTEKVMLINNLVPPILEEAKSNKSDLIVINARSNVSKIKNIDKIFVEAILSKTKLPILTVNY